MSYRRSVKSHTYRRGPRPVTRMRGRARLAQARASYAPRVTVAALQRAQMASLPKKGVDSLLTLAAIPSDTGTNAGVQCLNLVAPGSGSWNRVGRSVHLRSLRIKAEVSILDNTPETLRGMGVRMLIVWDQQPAGDSLPVFSDIFGLTTQTGTESSTVLCPPRYDNMERFRVLRDELIDFNPTSDTTTSIVNNIQIDRYIKLNNLQTNYKGQSDPSTIADISTGALYIIWRVTNTTSVASVSANSVARLRYTD